MVRGGVERSETEGIRRFENQISLIKEGGRDLTNAKIIQTEKQSKDYVHKI